MGLKKKDIHCSLCILNEELKNYFVSRVLVLHYSFPFKKHFFAKC